MNRFWNKVEKSNECWVWKGGKRSGGYGSFWMGEKHLMAHRVAYELEVGAIPKGKHVLHVCDNPPCVNPDHLFLGTHSDNMQDKMKKGRNPNFTGEKNPAAILTKEKAMEVRRRAMSGEDQGSLSKEFGISQPTVSAIKLGRIWQCQNHK